MRRHFLGLVSGLAMLVPLAALAQEPTAPAQSSESAQAASAVQPASATQPADPIVCNYYFYEGTVIRRPDCRTRHQWDRRRYSEQRFIREFQLHALTQE